MISNCRSNSRRNPQHKKFANLVVPEDTWPPITKNAITMTIDPLHGVQNCQGAGSQDDKWFVYEYSDEYQELQELFMSEVHNADADFMFNLISQHPYHIDSLIQLSELCKYNFKYLNETAISRNQINITSVYA